jgi:hypothetical protein
MYIKSVLTTLFMSLTMLTGVSAQTIGGVTATPQTVKVGEPVSVVATVDVAQSNYCGFIVFFGDGTSVESVSDYTKTGPLVVNHTYTTPGNYTISMGGRSVQSHPNCGGADKFATVKVEGPSKAAVPATVTAASACPAKWKLVPKSFNAKNKAFACSAKPGTAAPEVKTVCTAGLTYYENLKKGQLGCRL